MSNFTFYVGVTIILCAGCSSSSGPDMSAEQNLTDKEHKHYHVHAVDASHEHEHENSEFGGHAHRHDHPDEEQ